MAYGEIIENNFQYYSYPTKKIDSIDILSFQKEYGDLQLFFENDCSSEIVCHNNLYLMDTEAKLAFIRDYLNNDLLGFVLDQILLIQSEDEERNVVIDVKLLLLNKNLIINNNHKKQISYIKDIGMIDNFKFLLNLLS